MSVPNQAAPAAAPAAPVSQPQAPLSVDERISQRAKAFVSEIQRDDPTDTLDPNPQEEAPVEAQTEDVQHTEDVDQEAETPALESDVSLVEVDIDGEKFQIPEKVKHRVMADKDYRQKTMEVSATKKQLEQSTAKVAEITQQAQQLAPHFAQLHVMDNRAQYLQQQMQSARQNADPLAYNEAQGELAILLRNRDHFAAGLQQHQAKLNQDLLELRAKQLAIDAPKLFEVFPDLQKPETQQKLARYVQDEGLPQEAIDFLNYSAAGVKLVHKARLYDEMVADQAKSREKLKETVKGLPAATSSSRAADPGAKTKSLRETWKKNGGNINDPAFSAYLRSKLRG